MRLSCALRSAALSLSFVLATAGLCQAQTVEPTKQFIYKDAPFPSAHASTIVEVGKGEFLSAWFGGTKEGAPDVAIWMSRRAADGAWSAPAEMAREPGTPTWNPVLFHAKTGRLWLYFKYGPHPSEWTAARRYSDDDGKTWSQVEHLPAGVYGPIRAKPYVAPDGTIISGSSVESYHSWSVWVERSTDNGMTWTRTGPITLPELLHAPSAALDTDKAIGLIQPTVIPMNDGKPGMHLRLYMRSSIQIHKICVSDSTDGGKTWTDARKLDVNNPNSGIDIIRLKDRRFVLLYNDTPTGRTPLNLAVSKDGEHFTNFATVENETPGEFSYPALIQGTDGDLHMTYTWQRKTIRYATFPLASIPR
jgi:predicted neuraminidase